MTTVQVPWNKGLTKQTDPRMKRISQSQKGRVNVGKHNSLATEIKKGQHFSRSTEFRKGNQAHKGYHHSQETKENLRKLFASTRVKTKCDYCKTNLSLVPYRVKNHQHHFCSVSCQRHFYSGRNNNKWKGGVTPDNIQIRHSIEFKTWRKAVFERDDYTCQMCDKRGGRLHPHHIKSFAEYLKLRFEVSNGQTLCGKCHNKTHGRIITNRNGKGRFTKMSPKVLTLSGNL